MPLAEGSCLVWAASAALFRLSAIISDSFQTVFDRVPLLSLLSHISTVLPTSPSHQQLITMPGQWTLEEGIAFTTQIVGTLGAKVTRKPFEFIRNEKIPTEWTAEDVKKLNRVVWALLLTPLTWEAIEDIWKTYIMVRS